MSVFGKLKVGLAVFLAFVLLRPEPAAANSPQQNSNAVSQLHNHWASGQMGEDLLNFFGTSSAELTENWENRGAFADELGQRFQNGQAVNDLGALGVGVLKGGWAGITEVAALGWDGLAALGMGMAYGQHPDAMVQALDEYQPASSLIQAIKQGNEEGMGLGEFAMGLLQGLAETPAELLRSAWNDPEKAGVILSQFLLKKFAMKGVRRAGSRALSARRAGAGAASSANPCKITRCSIADDLKSVTRSSSPPSAATRATSSTPRASGSSTGPTASRGAAASAASQSATSAVGRKISQKQLRHIKDRNEWLQRGQGSYLNSVDDAQSVLDAMHSGSATVLGKTNQGHIVVRFEGVTGFNNNAGAGFVNQPTNVFMIKGTTKPSVVPTNPNWMASP